MLFENTFRVLHRWMICLALSAGFLEGNATPAPVSEEEAAYFKALQLTCDARGASEASDFPLCLQYCRSAMSLIDTVKPSLALAELHELMGDVMFENKESAQGLWHLKKALSISQTVCPEGGVEVAMAATSLGSNYYLIGRDIRKARQYLEIALAAWLKAPDPNQGYFSRTLITLAATCRKMGEYTRATELLNQALLMRQKEYGEYSEEAVACMMTVGNVYFEAAQYQQAKDEFEEAIFKAQRSNRPLGKLIADMKNNLAVTLVELGEFDAAHQLYKEIKAYHSAPATLNKRRVILAMENTGLLLVRMKQFDAAKKEFDALIDYAAKAQTNAAILAQIQEDIVFYFSETKATDSALAHVQLAIHLLDTTVSPTDLRDNPKLSNALARLELRTTLMTKGQLFLQAYREGRGSVAYLSQALEALDLAIALLDEVWMDIEDPGDKLYVNQNGVSMYEEALDITQLLWKSTSDIKHLDRALNYMERGKSQLMMESIRRERAAFLTDMPEEFHQEALELRAKVASLNQRKEINKAVTDSMTALHWAMMEVRMAQDRLSKRIEDEYPAYSEMVGQRAPVGLPMLLKRFSSPSELFVEYFLSDSSLYVLSVRQGKADFRKAALKADFQSDYDQFLSIIRNGRTSQADIKLYQDLGLKLYQELVGPELENCKDQVTRIRIVPDGELAAFPFEALPISKKADASDFSGLDLAIEKYLISYSGSASLMIGFAETFPTKYPSQCFGLAWSSGAEGEGDRRVTGSGRHWPEIPGTAQELKGIEGKVFGKYLMAMDATEAAFKKFAPDYGVIHLALHGSASGDEPFLAFPEAGKCEDGTLFLDELYSLQLRAQLTVLSACETGVGMVQKGEGVMSMAHGFGIAGCPSVVMSLWEVADNSSSIIMEDFYGGLSKGKEIDVALRDAKIAFLNSDAGRYTSPFYWATFIPVGKTDAVILERRAATWPYALAMGSIAMLFAAIFILRHRNTK